MGKYVPDIYAVIDIAILGDISVQKKLVIKL